MKKITPYMYILPCTFTILLFLCVPIIYNVGISFTEFKGIDYSKIKWIGLSNYKSLLSDLAFLVSIKNVVVFMILTIFFQITISLLMTMLLEYKLFGSRLFEIVYFFPSILSSVIIGYMFNQIFEPNFGFLNMTLRSLGFSNLERIWLGDARYSLYCVLVANVYQWTGMGIIYYRTGLTSISKDIKESALIDGANERQVFWKIIFPLLRPAHLTMVLMGTIGTLKFFDLIYIMTKGGPAGATEFPMTYLYKRFSSELNYGIASTVSVLVLIFAFIISYFQVKLTDRGTR